MWKKCKVIKLETEHEVPAFYSFPNISDDGYDTYLLKKEYKCAKCIKYHLYFLSDDEIKKGDWCYNPNVRHAVTVYPDGKQIENLQPAGIYKHVPTTNPMYKEEKKIIASTDPSLNVARPSDDFIKEYCHKGGIDEVMIEYEKEFRFESTTNYELDNIVVNGEIIDTIDRKTPYELKQYLKVAPDNTVTIRKVKDSWSREEVENFILQKLDIFYMNIESKNHRLPLEKEIKDFLRENL